MKNKSELPNYINCNSKTITHCDYYMHQDCKETCAYAWDIKGIGCGAADIGTVKRLEDKLNMVKE